MRRLILSVVIIVGIAVPEVFAWSDAGHKIIASIAFRRLSVEQQAKVIEIAKSHPRFREDFEEVRPADLDADSTNEWLFQQLAVWPDTARNLKGDARKEFNRPVWHYINVPHFLTENDRTVLKDRIAPNLSVEPPETADDSMNVIQAIRFARRTLRDELTSPENKARVLPWLFHLVGDVHQPLHSTALYSQTLFPEGDRGGNRVLTVQNGNLHSVWDRFPGGQAKYRTARNAAIAAMADAEFAKLGEQAAESVDEELWLNESHELCRTVVYDAEVLGHLREQDAVRVNQELKALSLSMTYLRMGRAVSDRRVVQAGYRLASVLSGIVE